MLNSPWSTVPWSRQVFSFFTTEAAAARRNRPWRTRATPAAASMAAKRGCNYAFVLCYPLPPSLSLSFLPPLSCPFSAACGYTPGLAQRFPCYIETGAPAGTPRTLSGWTSLQAALGGVRGQRGGQNGGQTEAARHTHAGAVSFYLSEGSCLSAR